ncbi:zinc dependent phospholipase C family protein [Methylotenera sp. 1P/1]|uniref:zinc dependent phospholipase C family protein n=1 Tax=Methylotenera sp. 1P/1 TaxID=1131551 RepID=UPI000477F8E4|nr:zinc dependent phospholipase C family protein [Methylotenera sp. 1P/1]
MQKRIMIKVLWGFPLLIYAMDANAWGLFTHIYFAQYVVLATPILDPRVQNAIKKFPQLVMAGACLPDLALISKHFKTTHEWQQAQTLLTSASTDEELAIAVGYTSHLFVDIVAHNHFVPAFEAKWLNASIVTHVTSEWAMDAYIRKHLQYRPFKLLRQHIDTIAPFIAQGFECSQQQAYQALNRLAWADKLLRFSQLSQLCLHRIRHRDDEFVLKLEYYLQQTHEALQQFEPVLKGQTPALFAELTHMSATEMVVWREKCLIEARLRLTTAVKVYQDYQQQLTTPHA